MGGATVPAGMKDYRPVVTKPTPPQWKGEVEWLSYRKVLLTAIYMFFNPIIRFSI